MSGVFLPHLREEIIPLTAVISEKYKVKRLDAGDSHSCTGIGLGKTRS